MARGDQIYVMRPLINTEGAYEHHGIDCGDGTVIHYYKGGEEAVIARTSLETFARGNPVFVKPYAVSYVPDVVVSRAESRLGERQYQLLTNNCEHFATWCKTGRNESRQLVDYGVGLGTLDPFNSRQMLDRAAAEGDPIKTIELFDQAQHNATTARRRLQTQATQTQKEMDSWNRVAQVALKRGREDLARAALERKVKYKRQWTQLQEQLQQLEMMQETLIRNSQKLQQQVAVNPIYVTTNTSLSP
jgi:Lecithin retinol acyltransferase/PspA/IM30 family